MWEKISSNFAVIGLTFCILGAVIFVIAPSIYSFISCVALMMLGQSANKIETLGWPSHDNFYKDNEENEPE